MADDKNSLTPESTLDKDKHNMERGVTNMPEAQPVPGKAEEGDEDYDDEITNAPATDE